MLKPLKPAPKAYKNLDFLNSSNASTIRILAEFLEPMSRFEEEKIKETVVFFGSARTMAKNDALKKLKEIRSKYTKNNKVTAAGKRHIEEAEMHLMMSKYFEGAARLAFLITKWASSLKQGNRFVICGGGGPGIMEAANKGAYQAGGVSIGLNISLPMEQYANPYITPKLNFEFHYFFMRKLWFMHLAKGMVVFPGGFGTMDEMMEVLTLIQTKKVKKYVPMVVYGREYWDKVINFQGMVDHRMIHAEDLNFFHFADTPEEAFEFLKAEFTKHYL